MPGESWGGSAKSGAGAYNIRCVSLSLTGVPRSYKQHPPRTLQQDYAKGPMVVLGVSYVSYGRGTPVFALRLLRRFPRAGKPARREFVYRFLDDLGTNARTSPQGLCIEKRP